MEIFIPARNVELFYRDERNWKNYNYMKKPVLKIRQHKLKHNSLKKGKFRGLRNWKPCIYLSILYFIYYIYYQYYIYIYIYIMSYIIYIYMYIFWATISEFLEALYSSKYFIVCHRCIWDVLVKWQSLYLEI